MSPDIDPGKEKTRQKNIFFRLGRDNVYPGPNTENYPLDPKEILRLRVLPPKEQQKNSGWLTVEIEEEIGGKIGKRLGYLMAPEGIHAKIFEEIEFMQKIIEGKEPLPFINEFGEKIKDCIVWIGNPSNPELGHFDES